MFLAYFDFLDRGLFSSAHFSPIFRYLLISFDSTTAFAAFIACVFAAFCGRFTPVDRLIDFMSGHPVSAATGGAALIAIASIAVYRGQPISMDEYAAVFQAKIFASGHVFARLPPDMVDWLVVRGFNHAFLDASSQTGAAISHYWPGFAALLAPFELMNAPWLCNAVLSGFALALIYRITNEISRDTRAAAWAVLFAISSGAFFAEGISFYSMQAHLTANLLFAALLMKCSPLRAFGAGIVGSLALLLHNPIPHLLFATPWIVALVLKSEGRRCLPMLAMGYVPAAVIGWEWLTFRSGFAATNAISSFSGTVQDAFAWPDVVLLNMRFAALAKMWVWASPCLFVFAFLGYRAYRASKCARLLALSALLTFSAYLFVRFDQGHGWGYRYFHSAWGAIPILAGCAFSAKATLSQRQVAFCGAATMLGLMVILPMQLTQIRQFIAAQLAQLPTARTPGNNVFFVRPLAGFYAADLVQFDPQFRDRDLILVTRGAELDKQLVMENWPDAVLVASTKVADQWYLGDQDRRENIPRSDRKRFYFRPRPSPPNAADR